MPSQILLTNVEFTIQVRGPTSIRECERLEQLLRKRLVRHFDRRGVAGFVEFEVEVVPGSVKGRIKVVIVALAGLLVAYGEFREAIDYVIDDAGYVAELAYRARNYVEHAEPDPVVLNREDGPVVSIGRILEDYDDGLMTREQANREIGHQLSLVNDADDREALVRALVELIDRRNPFFDWDALAGPEGTDHEVPPDDSRPPGNLPPAPPEAPKPPPEPPREGGGKGGKKKRPKKKRS
ncbi:MAG: hypothetical protein H6735_13680 [Alphaproteobacteria bacterium]|nr:hypothetical protein [Alphaproteobacteria bacterium]